jgi:hypothetical protein
LLLSISYEAIFSERAFIDYLSSKDSLFRILLPIIIEVTVGSLIILEPSEMWVSPFSGFWLIYSSFDSDDKTFCNSRLSSFSSPLLIFIVFYSSSCLNRSISFWIYSSFERLVSCSTRCSLFSYLAFNSAIVLFTSFTSKLNLVRY